MSKPTCRLCLGRDLACSLRWQNGSHRLSLKIYLGCGDLALALLELFQGRSICCRFSHILSVIYPFLLRLPEGCLPPYCLPFPYSGVPKVYEKFNFRAIKKKTCIIFHFSPMFLTTYQISHIGKNHCISWKSAL